MIDYNRCRKKVYLTETAALKDLKQVRKHPNGNGSGKPLHLMGAYLCPKCGHYHLGHSNKYLQKRTSPDLDSSPFTDW